MIILKERYDLSKIRNYMAKLGFEEFQSPMSVEREYSGLIAFRRGKWKVEFNYPPESLSFSSTTGPSWCSVKLSEIKSIDVNDRSLEISEKNGSYIMLWT